MKDLNKLVSLTTGHLDQARDSVGLMLDKVNEHKWEENELLYMAETKKSHQSIMLAIDEITARVEDFIEED